MKNNCRYGFTLVELLVVMSIIAIIAGLAFPAITSAVTQSQLTQVLSNCRQVHLAAQKMVLDGTSTGDTNLTWPGDNSTFNKMGAYVSALVTNDYLPSSSIRKMFSAPGKNADDNYGSYTSANTALKVYNIYETNEPAYVFLSTANLADNAASLSGNPFNTKGFVTFRKGGDGGIYKKNQATTTATNIIGIVGTALQ